MGTRRTCTQSIPEFEQCGDSGPRLGGQHGRSAAKGAGHGELVEILYGSPSLACPVGSTGDEAKGLSTEHPFGEA